MRSSTLLSLIPLAMAAPAKRASPAPVVVPRGADLIDGKYIVRMKADSVAAARDSAINSIKADADYTYSVGFNGFAATIDEAEIAKLQQDPNVDYIEQDAVVTISATETQKDAPWGLARLSSQKPGAKDYIYDSQGGEGTCAYIVDTGIDVKHPELEGRATWGANFAEDNDDTDGNGHGTHVAGTVGSKTYGVAKKTKLFAVKVLNAKGSGSNSGVIAGIEYVAKDSKKRDCPKGVVANMSLGGGFSKATNDAAATLPKAGVFLAVAAGNDAVDAKDSSPASEKTVCTVGATGETDSMTNFSNFGAVVDVFAPGEGILSLAPGGKTATHDGTSMASPHVAGLAAYLMGSGKKAEGLCEFIAESGVKDALKNIPKGTANVLINNGQKA